MANIKIFGKLVSGLVDKILAGTDNIFDSSLNKFQSDINKENKNQRQISKTLRFHGYLDVANIQKITRTSGTGTVSPDNVKFCKGIFYVKSEDCFAININGTYYKVWNVVEDDKTKDIPDYQEYNYQDTSYVDTTKYNAFRDKVYICGDDTYIWSPTYQYLVISSDRVFDGGRADTKFGGTRTINCGGAAQ